MVVSLLEAAEFVVVQWRSLVGIFKSIVTRDRTTKGFNSRRRNDNRFHMCV